jgi:hypothetical protein
MSGGRGSIWKRMRRSKRERRIMTIAECGLRLREPSGSERLRISEFGLKMKSWMAQRMIIKRMPSSMREKAQSSTEPKAMGVKISRRMRINLMNKLTMVIESLGH